MSPTGKRRSRTPGPTGAPDRGRGATPAGKRAPGRAVILLGPQAPDPTLGVVLADLESAGALAPDAPIATVTAGWREREGEPEIVPLGDRPRVDLALYRRSEELAVADPELAAAHRETQARLKLLRRAYNVRLAALVAAHAELGDLDGDDPVLAGERDDALEMLRALDRRHLERVAGIRAEYEARLRPQERPEVVRRREEIAAALGGAGAVAIAGGHVASLLNRLRGFGLLDLIGERPLIAWSAGAMVLSARILLFHDRPPWGPGNAELFERGLGVATGLVLLPHATRRLALDDPVRTGRLARRLVPDAAVLLDPGARLDLRDGGWVGRDVRRLDTAGAPVSLEEVAA